MKPITKFALVFIFVVAFLGTFLYITSSSVSAAAKKEVAEKISYTDKK
ncbi:MAG: hypothetical protein WDN75_15745 [Bacteroidota bacterium]